MLSVEKEARAKVAAGTLANENRGKRGFFSSHYQAASFCSQLILFSICFLLDGLKGTVRLFIVD